jgi:hypothetical protein
MSQDPDATIIAQALAMLRALARQANGGVHVMSATGKDSILDLLAQQKEVADDALQALARLEKRVEAQGR